MSNRERWIIYPLLTFALAMGLKDKLVPTSQIQARRIECAELITTSLRSESVKCNKMKADVVVKAKWIDAERLEATKLQGEQVVCSRLIVSADESKPQIVIYSTSDGGALVAMDAQGEPLGALRIPGGMMFQRSEGDAPPAGEDRPSSDDASEDDASEHSDGSEPTPAEEDDEERSDVTDSE